MKVLDKSWHMQCVKCCECQSVLSEKCYSRDSKLYCRTDFFKLFGTKCAGCNTGLCPEDLVRHTMNKVYHVPCFVCFMCRKQLATGEQIYFLQGEGFLCERCYQLTQTIAVAKTTTAAVVASPISNTVTQKQSVADTPSPQIGLIQSPMQHHATTTPTMQPSGDGRRSKTRTSINPQQLEVLMQIYNQEQRPSKQTREELMAKTGLEMKVIQVWFQNRRSKEKRDASYREANRGEENSGLSTPIPTPPPHVSTTPTPPSVPISLNSPVNKPIASNGQDSNA